MIGMLWSGFGGINWNLLAGFLSSLWKNQVKIPFIIFMTFEVISTTHDVFPKKTVWQDHD